MSTFKKIKIKHATIADKIYVKESDIEDLDSFIQAYTYLIGDEILFTYEHDEDKNLSGLLDYSSSCIACGYS